MDTVDQAVMPTTLLPFVCKTIYKTLNGYISSFNPTSSSVNRAYRGNVREWQGVNEFKPVFVESGDDEEDEPADPNFSVHAFTSRGYKRVRTRIAYYIAPKYVPFVK